MTVPQGTKRLLTGQAALGLGSYVLLIAAGRSLDTDAFAAFSVFWSLVFSFGLGLYGPLELMVLRLSALRRVSASSIEIPRLKRWYTWVGLLTGSLAAVFLLRTIGSTSHEPVAFAAAAFAYFQVLRTLAIQRGTAGGRGDLPRYARQVGVDGLARGVLAVGLFAVVVDAPWVWSWAVVLAGVAGAAAAGKGSTPPHSGSMTSEPPDDCRKTLGDVVVLTAGTSLSVILSNSLPTLAAMLGAATGALASLSAAVIVARIPVFFAGVGQALIVPAITSVADDPVRLGQVRSRILRAVAASSVVVMVIVGLATGRFQQIAFPSTDPLGPSVVGALAVSTGALMFALLGQGILIGQGRMSAVAGVWLTATAAGGAALALVPGGVTERIAASSAVSSIAASLALLVVALLLPAPVRDVPLARDPSDPGPDIIKGE